VTLSLDVRHPDNTERQRVCHELRVEAERLGEERGVAVEWQTVSESHAVPCSSVLADLLAAAVEQAGQSVVRLPSGAGHDAVTMSALTDVAMLFVRCAGGISHNPAESVAPEDVAVAIAVLERFLALVARERKAP
jgi:acetylornithine deacetylase/succinyl-diaminopimelate desuccinylase-like protein